MTTRLFQVEEEIRKRHGGAIGEVTMCLGNYSNDLIMHDKSKTLRDMGIAAACEAVLLYDFKPIQAPMLTTQFNYRTGKEGQEQ